MDLPYFFFDSNIANANVELNEETSRHIVQVLRMENGEKLMLANGKGQTFKVEISNAHKKYCRVNVLETFFSEKPKPQVSIAISLLKNSSRFEWFLEKAVEIGVQKIIPLICKRTEKQHFRFDRMKAITISAMLQSKQSYLAELSEPKKINDFVIEKIEGQKFIAHCEETGDKNKIPDNLNLENRLILIGPEGDFTHEEIHSALTNNFSPVTLGQTRLRTETAGIVAATLLCN